MSDSSDANSDMYPDAWAGTEVTLQTPDPAQIALHTDGEHLFSILSDGTIVRGPAFKTNDQASLEFWRILENVGYLRAGKVPLDDVARHLDEKREKGDICDALNAMHTRRRIDGR